MKKRFLMSVLCVSLGIAACGSNTPSAPAATADSSELQELQRQIAELQEENNSLKEQLAALTETEEETEPSVSAGEFDEASVLSSLAVQEHSFVNSINSYQLFLVITNNSDQDIALSAELTTKGEDGNLIGAKSGEINAFEKGTTVCMSFYLDEEPASYDYSFTASEEDYYKSVSSNLSYETSIAQDKAIVSVTNNGDIPIEFAEYTALFFNGDTLVGSDSGYVTDDDSEIKPGKTINDEADCYEDFDSVQIYLTGRA